GQGAVFWFTADFEVQGATPTVVLPRPELAGRRGLVVDDNATNRDVLARQLSAWRVRAQTVATGAEALAALRGAAAAGEAFDFCVLDMHMPGMNGLELAKAIRADAALQPVRLILLSSISQTLSRQELDAHGIAAGLTKPVRQAALQDAVSRALGMRPASNPPFVGERSTPRDSVANELTLRILLAEDNPVNRQVARLQLEKCGSRADVVTDGQQAVDAVRAGAYDIVLMDCQMPVLDGFGATREIRTWEAERRARGEVVAPVYIIAMTAGAMVGDREACLAAGMDDYLSKPVRTAELAAAIARSPAAQS
ncbi:MAG: response regulator, partial [Verrucomicrobiota bacterium]